MIDSPLSPSERTARTVGESGRARPAASGRWVGLCLVLVAVVAAAATVGLPVPLGDLWSADPARHDLARRIFFELRVPRLLAGLLVGASLASSGAALQAVFRNPLAEPYLLGISAGGALGATVAAALHLPSWGCFDAATLLAFGGALGATALVYQLGQGRLSSLAGAYGGFDRSFLLVIGVAISSFLAASMALVVTLSNRYDLAEQVTFWLLGGLSRAGWPQDAALFATLICGLVTLTLSARDLNALQVGDLEAASLGVSVRSLHRRLLLVAALMSATAVAAAGLIGFVGLLAPHLMRQLFPANARSLIPAAAIGGAVLLVGCDAIARSVLGDVEIPVGVVTSLLGVPLFLALARRGS